MTEENTETTRRYFVALAYDGTAYHGWQAQPNGDSVQAELERALSLLLGRQTAVVGAGRTDAGVHARMMVAHFDTTGGVDCQQLAYRLNRLLPRDIAVSRVEAVGSDMHARFSARERTYRYYVHTEKNPFLRQYSCELRYPLDFGLMNQAAATLLEYDDFGAFCKTHTDVKTKLCHVVRAEWLQAGAAEWVFVISANRFLRNMVRAVVGTLIDVGRHRLTVEGFRAVVEGRRRTAAGESMPANALFLEEIKY